MCWYVEACRKVTQKERQEVIHFWSLSSQIGASDTEIRSGESCKLIEYKWIIQIKRRKTEIITGSHSDRNLTSTQNQH